MSDDLVDTIAAALAVGVPASTMRTWASRHKAEMPKRGRDARGRSLYSLTEVRRVHQKYACRT